MDGHQKFGFPGFVPNTAARFLSARQLDHVQRFQSLVGLGDLELNAVTFIKRLEALATNDGKMNENVLSSLILRDEPETLLIIEPFNYPVRHSCSLRFVDDNHLFLSCNQKIVIAFFLANPVITSDLRDMSATNTRAHTYGHCTPGNIF
jgi:hypothetical protein